MLDVCLLGTGGMMPLPYRALTTDRNYEGVYSDSPSLYGRCCDGSIICKGESICQNCYEVSEDVAEAFKDAYLPEQYMKMTKNIGNGKYLLDLHRANYYNLTGAGILPEHINVTDICTCCNPDFLFSHRASHGKRGNLGAVIMLKSTADGGNVNE